MIRTPRDVFPEWAALPLKAESSDPRFEVRQATPADFEEIYDVVDQAFGTKRPRELFDWQYRQNPHGLARAFILLEKSSGKILKSGSAFPWPVWVGDKPVLGELSGDAATLPEWQRNGLSRIRRDVRRSHPWRGCAVMIAGPNEGSRVVTAKVGDGDQLMGALSGGVVTFRSGELLERVGFPTRLAGVAGGVADGLLGRWQSKANRLSEAGSSAYRIEPIRRFTADFDPVTLQHMAWSRFWCPHNADFLNWRYQAHPVESYVSMALVLGDEVRGYAVVRLAGQEATLTEFVAGERPSAGAPKLLRAAMKVAREAGCAYMKFFSTSTWRHWPLFRHSGFLPYKTKNHVQVTCDRYEPEIWQLKKWQLTPGDRDFQ